MLEDEVSFLLGCGCKKVQSQVAYCKEQETIEGEEIEVREL